MDPPFLLLQLSSCGRNYISGILLPFCPIPSCTPIKKAKVNYLTGIFVGGGIVSASFTLGLFLAIMYKLYRGLHPWILQAGVLEWGATAFSKKALH